MTTKMGHTISQEMASNFKDREIKRLVGVSERQAGRIHMGRPESGA
jgi:hypothetical protein